MRDPRLIIGSGHLVGVEAEAEPDGSWSFHWVHLHKRKGGIRILRQGWGVNDVTALRRAIDPRYPVVIVVNSDRTLLRHVRPEAGHHVDISKLLPNAEPGSLIVDRLHAEGITHLAIARKESLEPLVAALIQAGFRPLELFLGPVVLLCLDDVLAQSLDIPIGRHRFAREGRVVTAHQRVSSDAPRTLGVGDQNLDERCAVAMAGVWQHWFRVLEHDPDELPAIPKSRREEKSRLVYERGQIALLVLILGLLTFDVGLRQHLSQDRGSLETAIAAQEEQDRQLVALQSSVDQRRRTLSISGIDDRGDHVRTIDRIASSVPLSIQLDEIWMAPLQEALREDKEPSIRAGIIRLKGTSGDAAALTSWMVALKGTVGVRNVRLVHLQEGARDESPAFVIELELA